MSLKENNFFHKEMAYNRKSKYNDVVRTKEKIIRENALGWLGQLLFVHFFVHWLVGFFDIFLISRRFLDTLKTVSFCF